ncbi:CBS domain-containing protein [Vibrio pectenicida]|uniref:CBS domain-containing protein n=1 Tax=Vibrio pectenicida TaxID=62763 RepID=A0A7Y3ZWD0_9VIBR|nr:nucleotidyltransferase family protein [Vibrio pectenicida]NOH70307.1 CBS domain-containing protein [Vibrio pectenicida]
MENIKDIKVTLDTPILDVIEKIDESSKQIALVVDDDDRLLGTINDGDIRRGILNGVPLTEHANKIYCSNPTTVSAYHSRNEIIRICHEKKIHQIPVVDENGRTVGIEILDELIKSGNRNNRVVLMVGGLGSRLRPLTEHIPKPMLKVGGKPILETIISRFSSHGFRKIILCVNYKSNIIRDHFGDGSDFGVEISYVEESKRMGTAGALSLLEEVPDEPIFIMNGDLLTNINFEHLLDYHERSQSIATMCVREFDIEVPFGVVEVKEDRIEAIKEKPKMQFFVNAGIYVLSPNAIEVLPKGEYYDMPSLFEALINNNENVVSFPLREYWLDIGRIDEFNRANEEFNEVFL